MGEVPRRAAGDLKPASAAARQLPPPEGSLFGKEFIVFMAKLAKALLKILKVLGIVIGVLFVVYFWNLDQKVLGWAYKQVNAMFDRKKVDLVF